MATTTAETSYEKERKQRMDENKKRMEQLNLFHLSQALKNKPYDLKKTKVKVIESGVEAPLRRSTRMSGKPTPNYTQFAVESTTTKGQKLFLRRDQFYHVDISNDERYNAVARAEKLESHLGSEFPTFIKPLLLSHTRGIVRIPTSFCKTCFGDHDQMFTLVDEDGNKWQTKYVARYNSLIAGWKGFSVHHELADGDALVFQLIEPTTFKVYIVRASATEEDGKAGS